MKKFLLFLILALAVTAMVSTVSVAQVKVTFIANTAAISDTIGATSTVRISGDFPTPLPSWGDGILMSNIGGDYWSATITVAAGTVIANGYKFRANGGWEGDFAPATNNRALTVGTKDTVLPVQYYYTGGFAAKPDQYWKPFPITGSDSLTVWFRVNMKAVIDSSRFGWTAADKDSVALMGDNGTATGDIDWSVTHYLKRESNPNFFSGRVRFAKAGVTDGKVIQYKFRLGNLWGRDELQGGKPNRSFTIPIGKTDTTLAFVYYNNDLPKYAQPVKVTFIVNTATISDTILGTTSKLAISGDFPSPLPNWGDGIPMTNIGGDYWSTTVVLKPGPVSNGFKFRANGGWENDLGYANNNRGLVVGTSDTTLPVQFYNTTTLRPTQYWTPYPKTGSDSLTVWFRVNMQAVIENKTFGWTDKDKDSVVIMGDNVGATSDLDWGVSHYLVRETNPYFFSGRVRFAKAAVTAGKVVNYKYRLGNLWGRDELQGKPNRTFPITIGKTDTTIAYVYFDNAPPIARVNADTCAITFRVDMKNAIGKKGFAQGDTIVVQSGFFKTGAVDGKEKQLKLVIGSIYQVVDTIVTSVNKLLNYQYYLVKNGQRVREYYFNFDYTGTNNSEQERRQVTVASKSFSIFDTTLATSVARRQPLFPSQVPLKQAVTVRWVVDLRPAYAQIKTGSVLKDGQGTSDVMLSNRDSIKLWGVGINGPATNLPTVYPVGDWAPWNALNLTSDTSKRRMWDNGTHGDAKAGDTLYTVTYTYPIGDNAGKVSKYGIKGGDNETAFGLNHLDNIDDAAATFTINVAWGSINPKFYSAWDYNRPPDKVAMGEVVPKVYALEQNYPNPFNPATQIEFSLPVQSNVTMVVYNVIGQEVATLVNGNLMAGKHTVSFDASRLSSGVYFYRLIAGDFTSIKKMMLMK